MASNDKSAGRVLLPPTVEPIAYDIKLSPNLESFTFTGTESVNVNVISACTEIQLHAKDLYVSTATFKGSGDGAAALEATEINFHVADTVLTIKFSSEIPLGAGEKPFPPLPLDDEFLF
jgi:hypothetical protein